MKTVLFFIVLVVTSISCKSSEVRKEPGSIKATEKLFISADGGLRMRNQPSLEAEKIITIPNNSEVIKLQESGDEITISGKTGKWTKVKFENTEGWVFGGFLVTELPKLKSYLQNKTIAFFTPANYPDDSCNRPEKMNNEGIKSVNTHWCTGSLFFTGDSIKGQCKIDGYGDTSLVGTYSVVENANISTISIQTNWKSIVVTEGIEEKQGSSTIILTGRFLNNSLTINKVEHRNEAPNCGFIDADMDVFIIDESIFPFNGQ